MIALDINYPGDMAVKSDGVAFFRMEQQMKEFFEKVAEDHKIIGFEYDAKEPWNFGLILQDIPKAEETKDVSV